MNDQAENHYLAETIAREVFAKVLECYRKFDNLELSRILDRELTDLGVKIRAAVAAVPEPDEYETWLQEKIHLKPEDVAWCFEVPIDVNQVNRVTRKPLPTTGQEITPPSPAAHNNSGAPISGDAPEPTELSEPTATADQQQADEPGGIKEIGSAGRGAEPVDYEKFITASQIWKEASGLSNEALGKLAGVSGVTIGALLKGDKVSVETIQKVRKAIKEWAEKDLPPEDDNYCGPMDAENYPGPFIRLKTLAWMNREGHGVKDAAEIFSVTEGVIRQIQAAEVPHENVINRLSVFIPAIRENLDVLVAASQREAA